VQGRRESIVEFEGGEGGGTEKDVHEKEFDSPLSLLPVLLETALESKESWRVEAIERSRNRVARRLSKI